MTTLNISFKNAFSPVVAGQLIQGCIALFAQSAFSASRFEAFLIGEEMARVENETPAGDKRAKHKVQKTRCFLHVPIVVDDHHIIHNGIINQGNYQLPFEVELPSQMPSSMKKIKPTGKCEISYHISVRILGSGVLYNYNTKSDFQVIAKSLPLEPFPFISEPVAEPVNVCCCFNRGHAVLAARVEDTVLGKSERVKVYMDAYNNSTVRIRRVYAELKEYVSWEAGRNKTETVQSLSRVDFPVFAGLEPRTYDVSSRYYSQEDQAAILKDILKGDRSGWLSIPETANDTFKGQLIECRHVLRVCLETRCCVTHPAVEIPLQIGSRKIKSGSTAGLDWTTFQEPSASSTAPLEPTILIPETAPLVSGTRLDEVDTDTSALQSTAFPSAPTVETLLVDMKNSINDLEDIRLKLTDDRWEAVFASLSPEQFGKVIQSVELDFDQPRVAELIAPVIQKNGNFTCEHCVQGVRNASHWSRTNIVLMLVPYCVDLTTGQDKILDELSDWERAVTASAFENATRSPEMLT